MKYTVGIMMCLFWSSALDDIANAICRTITVDIRCNELQVSGTLHVSCNAVWYTVFFIMYVETVCVSREFEKMSMTLWKTRIDTWRHVQPTTLPSWPLQGQACLRPLAVLRLSQAKLCPLRSRASSSACSPSPFVTFLWLHGTPKLKRGSGKVGHHRTPHFHSNNCTGNHRPLNS